MCLVRLLDLENIYREALLLYVWFSIFAQICFREQRSYPQDFLAILSRSYQQLYALTDLKKYNQILIGLRKVCPASRLEIHQAESSTFGALWRETSTYKSLWN